MKARLAHGLLLPLLGTCRRETELPIEIRSQASRHNFDYRAALDSAHRGETDGLKALIEFSRHADAGGAISHGIILVGVLDSVGDAPFANVLATCSRETRSHTAACVEAGIDYGKGRDPAEASRIYPRSWATAHR